MNNLAHILIVRALFDEQNDKVSICLCEARGNNASRETT